MVVAFSVVIAILVTTRLTSSEQGVYFVFQSMIAFSAIAELGVGYSITQLTGKALGVGLASQSEPVEMIGARFLGFTVKWFAWVAILVLIVIGPAGHYWLVVQCMATVRCRPALGLGRCLAVACGLW